MELEQLCEHKHEPYECTAGVPNLFFLAEVMLNHYEAFGDGHGWLAHMKCGCCGTVVPYHSHGVNAISKIEIAVHDGLSIAEHGR